MPMTVVVTRDVANRFRGFLASVMLEIAPGVYTAPRMTSAVRGRVLDVLVDWYEELGGGSIVMTWRDGGHPAGQSLAVFGEPPVELVDQEGMILKRRELTGEHRDHLGESKIGSPTAPETDPMTDPNEV